ncbi:complement factor H-like isoform X1 [Amphiprion ocellaris]|uniref:complement factor H-like isoform X1 n=1 Tax=Amphiprion ocellaris TaxID=80972 RepID=UPI0024113B6D|nr:complement factor H-like isoform X1 [Amphiprion ocellaris]
MCVRHLAFVLLIWFPAVLHAQKAEQPCLAPQLHGGDFIPKRETYPHEKQLIYTCDEGYKPTAEGWWATSTCENGQWSPKPQCIDEKSCLPPTIPNGYYIGNSHGWYAEHRVITVKCDDGYELNGQSERIRCINGTWPSLPVCERSPTSSGSNGGGSEHPFATIDKCGDIPVVPNGDVVQTGLRSLKYQCVNYYKLEGPDIVVCYRDGTWSQVPTCKAAFCSVDTNVYPQLKSVGVKYIKDGESERLECEDLWLTDHFSQAQCTDGRVKLSRCCNRLELIVGDC